MQYWRVWTCSKSKDIQYPVLCPTSTPGNYYSRGQHHSRPTYAARIGSARNSQATPVRLGKRGLFPGIIYALPGRGERPTAGASHQKSRGQAMPCPLRSFPAHAPLTGRALMLGALTWCCHPCG